MLPYLLALRQCQFIYAAFVVCRFLALNKIERSVGKSFNLLGKTNLLGAHYVITHFISAYDHEVIFIVTI